MRSLIIITQLFIKGKLHMPETASSLLDRSCAANKNTAEQAGQNVRIWSARSTVSVKSADPPWIL